MSAVPVTVALEGGSLGVSSCSVLDRVVNAPNFRIEAVSGASAGLMNAAMLAQGIMTRWAARSETGRLTQRRLGQVARNPW